MSSSLPDDILYLICTQLWHQRDFNTLYHCTLAGKQLAIPALTNIYRMYDVSPVTNRGSSDVDVSAQERAKTTYTSRLRQEEVMSMRWAQLWRTIILSSLEKTLFPYCRYIRTLNLEDLEELFQDKNFKDRVSTMFFSGELAQHKVETRSGFKKHPNRLLLDGVATLNALGEIITRKTTMLEELSGKILNDSLLQWASRLPRLKSLNLWDGGALVGAGSKLHEYCHSFNTLKFWSWGHEGADQKFAEFLREIVPQTLESLEVFSFSSIEAESFLALGGHGDSLTELKLHSLNSDAMHSLNKLKDCINLTTLLFTDGTNRNVNLKRGHPDIFQDIVAWLRQCKKLRSVTFRDLQGGQDLMTSILLEDSIHLTSLELKGYIMADSHEFHQALANQPTLQELLLHGETDEAGDGVATLVESLSQLANLTELRLQDISDYFTDEVISRLARSLPKLEGWWTSGWGVTDAVWRDIASLKSLRRLDLAATSRFTSNGILDFIFGLGPGNKGLVLAIMMADVDCNLSDEEQAMIRETIANQVDGRFEFQLQRDPDISEYEGESD